MAKKHFIQSTTTTVKDKDGNEVITDEKKLHSVILDDTDKFYMVYFNMLRTFYQIKYLKDVLLLFKLCEMANFNTGIVSLSANDRFDLCVFLNVQNSNLSTGLKRLKLLGLIFGDKGRYTINESVFWKGDKEMRKQLLKDRGIDFIIRFKTVDGEKEKVSPEISMPEGDEDALPNKN